MPDPLTEKIIAAAIEVHRVLGPGLLESIYEEALAIELELRGLSFRRQVPVDVHYKGRVIKGQCIDLIVEEQVVVELKSVSKLPEVATAQTLSYLRAAGLKRALLLNFGMTRLVDGIKRLSLQEEGATEGTENTERKQGHANNDSRLPVYWFLSLCSLCPLWLIPLMPLSPPTYRGCQSRPWRWWNSGRGAASRSACAAGWSEIRLARRRLPGCR
jgi:GxxExxY protein